MSTWRDGTGVQPAAGDVTIFLQFEWKKDQRAHGHVTSRADGHWWGRSCVMYHHRPRIMCMRSVLHGVVAALHSEQSKWVILVIGKAAGPPGKNVSDCILWHFPKLYPFHTIKKIPETDKRFLCSKSQSFPLHTGGGFTFYYTSNVMTRFFPHVRQARPLNGF